MPGAQGAGTSPLVGCAGRGGGHRQQPVFQLGSHRGAGSRSVLRWRIMSHQKDLPFVHQVCDERIILHFLLHDNSIGHLRPLLQMIYLESMPQGIAPTMDERAWEGAS